MKEWCNFCGNHMPINIKRDIKTKNGMKIKTFEHYCAGCNNLINVIEQDD